MTITTASYQDVLSDLCDSDPRLVVMTAENRATLRRLGPRLGDRFIDVGIAEQTMVGAAAGMALGGHVPIVHGLAAFLTMRAFEFCRTDVGLGGLPVKLVGNVPGFLSEHNGPTHQAIEDVALMRLVPEMRIFAPADRDELAAALPGIVSDPYPWYIRFNDRPGSVGHRQWEPGVAETLCEGADVTILTYGHLVDSVLSAARRLELAGVAATVVNMRTLAPFDVGAILAALDTRLCVTVEDHLRTGGLATIVAEVALAHRRSTDVLALALDTFFPPGDLESVIRACRFDPDGIAHQILERLERP